MNTTELKALAEKVTPGPWHWDGDPVKGDPLGRNRFRVVALGRTITQCYYSSGDEMAQTEASYIAAANPAEILELIAQLEDAQGEIRALRATEAGLQDRLAQVEAEHAALLKAISDAEPVAWINEEQTIGPNFLKRHLSFGKYFSDNPLHYKHIPLYTLNGIKP